MKKKNQIKIITSAEHLFIDNLIRSSETIDIESLLFVKVIILSISYAHANSFEKLV